MWPGVICGLLGAMESTRFDLSDKTALVTGSGRGIGLAIAQGLAEHGADVALAARSEDQLAAACDRIEAEIDAKAWPFPVDLADLERLDDFFSEVVQATGGVDILVNCAGTTIRGPSEEVTLAEFNHVMEVNLTSALVLSQALCSHCREFKKPGRIVNIGSLTCQAARPTTAAYAASKAGLLGLTRRFLPGLLPPLRGVHGEGVSQARWILEKFYHDAVSTFLPTQKPVNNSDHL